MDVIGVAMVLDEIYETVNRIQTQTLYAPKVLYVTQKELGDIREQYAYSRDVTPLSFDQTTLFGIPLKVVDETDGRRISQRRSWPDYQINENSFVYSETVPSQDTYTILEAQEVGVQMEESKYMRYRYSLGEDLNHLRTEYNQYNDAITNNLVHTLRTNILSDEGGKTVKASAFYWQKQKPWWIPRVLWDRIPERKEVTEAYAIPKWTYPSANLRHPELGEPVRKIILDGERIV